jgi:hypothetical protein
MEDLKMAMENALTEFAKTYDFSEDMVIVVKAKQGPVRLNLRFNMRDLAPEETKAKLKLVDKADRLIRH